MGTLGKPTAPAAPNPSQVAGQQTAADISTAIANSYIGNANETNPYGSVTYRQQPQDHVINGPDGQQYTVPAFNREVDLNPAQQGLLDQQNQLGSSLNNLAINQTNKIGGILSSPVSADGLPARVSSVGNGPNFSNIDSSPSNAAMAGVNLQSVGAQAPIQSGINLSNSPTSFGASGPIANSFGDAGQIQRSIGPTDYSQQRSDVENAIYSRLNPQLDRDRNALETKLVNQGLVRGTDAFNTAMDEANRQANDARMQAILAGGNEQSRLANLALQSGNFANSAQGQAYQQAEGRGNFANAAQAQDYGQQQGRGMFGLQATTQNNQNAINAGNFANAAQQQGYNQNLGIADFNNQAMLSGQDFNNQVLQNRVNNVRSDLTFNNQNAQQAYGNQIEGANFQNTARQQGMQEQLALRNQPLNEISALMSGGQVTVPQFQQYNPGTVANSQLTNDIYGSAAINQQNYATKQSGTNALLGALGGICFAGLYGLAKR